MRLGLVTYNLAKDWDLETIIKNCGETGFAGVELRVTHAHKVESDLSPAQRREVRRRFADSQVELVGLGTAFEFDAVDPAELKRHTEGTKAYLQLAADLGASGVKVRPNKIHEDEGVPREQTFAQIGQALRQCAEVAAGLGVELRLEVHGRVTCEPPYIRTMLDHADHPSAVACWNSNPQDLKDGAIDANFALLEGRIGLVHINELWNDYPWRRLFALLRQSGYEGYCLAEISASADPLRLMRYYRALFAALAQI
ncbi:MAG: sugar phosphate isomerase/epimerase [Candidatus Handelsmanbacteria bacterium]|nr:sugar phosphate isomerase/epimerase [Candidatus Handelsmanbacteria bacterium]